jgi:Effector Associated Constant Component 1
MEGRSVIELSTEDADDLDALYSELRGHPGITVQAVFAPLEPGDQGSALDFLAVACSSGGAITVLIQILKDFTKARSSHFSLRVRNGEEEIELTAENIDRAFLRKILDAD